MDDLYRKIDGDVLPDSGRGVVYFRTHSNREGAVQFWCPCGKRRVYVTSPPHIITFDKDGVLKSLGGSCGYHESRHLGRPQNWCHFTIKDGKVETMHSDSKCPGGDNSIP